MTDTTTASLQLILVETFELVGAFDEYEISVKAFCNRVEQDGLSGVRLMQHYVSREKKEAFEILIFTTASVFEKHLSFISQLEELPPFSNTVKLKKIKAFGSMHEEQLNVLMNADFLFEFVDEHMTGFVRNR